MEKEHRRERRDKGNKLEGQGKKTQGEKAGGVGPRAEGRGRGKGRERAKERGRPAKIRGGIAALPRHSLARCRVLRTAAASVPRALRNRVAPRADTPRDAPPPYPKRHNPSPLRKIFRRGRSY